MKLSQPNELLFASIDSAITDEAGHIHAAITAHNRTWSLWWALPDPDLVAMLNRLGPERVLAIMEAHHVQALRLNESLDAACAERPDLAETFSTRATSVPQRQIEWDAENGTFVVVPTELPAEPQ